MTLLATGQLSKRYDGLQAVDNVDLTIDHGHIVGLVGPNGAGKTTLFNLLTGFVRPTTGRIWFKGDDITDWPPERRAELGLARTFQRSRVFPKLTVETNVRMGCFLQDRPRLRHGNLSQLRRRGPSLDRRVASILEQTGLDPFRDTFAAHLSFGYQRRLAVAIALGTDPELLLLDEPFGGLSPESTEAMDDLIQTLHEAGLTLLLIEHRMASIVTACNRLFVMHGGRLVIPHPSRSQEPVSHVER